MSLMNLALAQASANTEVDASFVTTSLPANNYVTVTDKYVPLTGVFATEVDINGWEWDKRRLEDWSVDRTRYNTFLGGHDAGLRDGTQSTHWQSGSITGLSYQGLIGIRESELLTWTPQVQVGEFTVHDDLRALFSDYSYSENVQSSLSQDGMLRLNLRDDAVYESIRAAIFKRTDEFLIKQHWVFDLVDEFTGELDTLTGLRADTQNADGSIIFTDLSERHKEAYIYDGYLWFNGLHQFTVGDERIALQSVVGTWEDKGCGLLVGRNLFSKYFPFEEDSVRVVTVDVDGNITTWTEQSTLNFSTSTDQHFSVNHDLGVITMGGYQAPNLVLKTAVDASADILEVYYDPETLESYSDSGVLTIGTEEIAYTEKTRSGFTGLVRGYNSTTAASHSVGAVISDIQHGAGTTDSIFISYVATPRVDYEVTDYDIRTANKSDWVDVRPATNASTNNILQILSANINLAEVVLETDEPLIGGNLYGPVYYGTDTAKLTARGLDSRGNPVDDIELNIELISGDGHLNGDSTRVTGISNTLGEIYAFYNSPYGADNMNQEVTSVTHDGADTVMTLASLSEAASAGDIWVFQVLKHDPVMGTVGKKTTVLDGGAAARPGINGYLEVDGLYNEDMKEGIAFVLDTSSVKQQFYIKDVTLQQDSGTGEWTTVLWTAENVDTALVTGQSAWLLEPGALQWDSTQKRGVNVILYEYTVNAQHPITGVAGAYTPVHPDSVSGTEIRFTGRNLPIPAPDDDDNNLGAYIIVAPSEVKFKAWGRDPFSGNIIESNNLRLELNLPNWLVGVDSSGALPIPYGFTLITEDFNVGAGLGGANFLTINPAATGINSFSITGVL